MPINKGKNYNLFIGALLFFTLILAGHEFQEKERYKLALDNNYEKSLSSTTKYIETVEYLLTKVQITKDSNQNASDYAKIWKEASQAQNSMANLPLSNDMIAITLNYLNEIMDLSYMYMQKSIDGENITYDELQQLDQLKVYTKELSYELKSLIAYANITNKLFWESNNMSLSNSLINVNRQFQNITALEYNNEIELEEVPQEINEISKGEAIEIVQNIFLDYDISDIIYIGTTNVYIQNIIPVYSFEVILNSGGSNKSMLTNITRMGGIPILIFNTNETPSGVNRFTKSDANETSLNFLDKIGFNNIELVCYEIYENNIVLTYCTSVDGIIIYPESIQVKVDLYTGEITGLDAKSYIQNYKEREIELPDEYIHEMISPSIEVLQTGLAVILSDIEEEVLCYEVYGKLSNEKLFIYVNVNNGNIEKIILI